MEKEINSNQLADYIDKLLGNTNSLGIAALDQAQHLLTRTHATQVQESERLLKKYGAQNERVQTAQARVSFNSFFAKTLDQGVIRAKLEIAPKTAGVWQLHGRVFDVDLNPQKDITVFLTTDPKASWLRDIGHACTDERGYYSLIVKDKSLLKLVQSPLYLAASNAQQEVVYRSSENLMGQAKVGERLYRDIVLNDKTCVEPPSGDVIKVEKPNITVAPSTKGE